MNIHMFDYNLIFVPFLRVGAMGFESKTGGSLIVRARGIEPRSQPWEGRILPLNHARMCISINELSILRHQSYNHSHMLCQKVFVGTDEVLNLICSSTMTTSFSPGLPTLNAVRSASSLPLSVFKWSTFSEMTE